MRPFHVPFAFASTYWCVRGASCGTIQARGSTRCDPVVAARHHAKASVRRVAFGWSDDGAFRVVNPVDGSRRTLAAIGEMWHETLDRVASRAGNTVLRMEREPTSRNRGGSSMSAGADRQERRESD